MAVDKEMRVRLNVTQNHFLNILNFVKYIVTENGSFLNWRTLEHIFCGLKSSAIVSLVFFCFFLICIERFRLSYLF